jgi:hypothetical protein
VLLEVKLDVIFGHQCFRAHGTTGIFFEPLLDAVGMENVETTEHLAEGVVGNGLNADHALLHHVLPVFHPYQGLLKFSVRFTWECFVYLEICTTYYLFSTGAVEAISLLNI